MMPEIAGIGVLTAFLAGIVSFLSPCVLPLVPGYVSFVAGRSLDQLTHEQTVRQRLAVLGLSSAFVLGFSTVFISLGASASAVGSLFQLYRFEASYIAGAVIILFGLHMMGALRLHWLHRELRFMPQVAGGRPFEAFFLGSAFAFGWTPCIGPVLAAILTLSATTVGVAERCSPSIRLGLPCRFFLSRSSPGVSSPMRQVCDESDGRCRSPPAARWLRSGR
jgi:cytochrome c-type biogenesis protein